ncbi:SERPINE1 mRNA-binding protein 1-like isoform X2 [Branchiostoma lanceolatum]|uniref:SERPINE1 mRNA-binding protein 1-like isoform X2 n=1 Tax=Branchiostoma lanceolatum TaxID=7740 RepID=UPI003454A29B
MPMDSEYGITVTNKYSFLVSDDEEDPSELRQKELAEKEEKARRNKEEKAKKAAKDPERKPKSAKLPDKKKPLSTSAKEKENVPDRPKKEDPPSTRPNRAERRRQQQESNTVNVDGDERSDRQPRRDRGNRPKRTQDNEEGGRNVFTEYRTERTDSDRAPRGRGGFGRGGRGRGRGGFFGGRDFRGKREFERHSGSEKSGVRPSEKRDGGGAYNWGSQTDAADDLNVTAGSAEENPEWTAPTEEGENSEAKEGAEGQEAPGEQEPKEMTLDEWKALQAKDTKPKATGFKLRKAGEGEDLTQWKKTYVLKKGQEEEDADKIFRIQDFFPLKDGQELRAVSSRGGERGQKQPSVELNFHFADSPQRGRGGRRGGRGRGGDDRPRGGGRGRGGVRYNGADPGAYIDVDNEADFPQLGK